MTNRTTTTLTAALAGTLFAAASTSANVITNGDFEDGTTGGVPTGWSFNANGGSLNVSVSPPNSTFPDSGSNSALLSGDGTTANESFFQNFASQTGQLEFVFDLFLADSTPNRNQYNAHLFGTPEAGTNGQVFAFNIDQGTPTGPGAAGDFILNIRGGNGPTPFVLDAQTWYRLTTNLDTDTDIFSTTIASTTGVVGTAAGKTFQNAVSNVSQVAVNDGTTGGASSNLRVDNFSLVVPEPASLALLGLGGLMMLSRRKRA